MSDTSPGPTAVREFSDGETPLGIPDVEAAMFDGELIVFHEATGMVHRLNSGASAVWLLCDGETPVGSMADELGELFGVDPAGLAHDVRQALTQLLQGGLLVGDDAVDAGGNAASQVDLLSEAAGEPSAVRTLRRPPDP